MHTPGAVLCGTAACQSYFLLGQLMTGQREQFCSSSFSIPKGIVSPHSQTQLLAFLLQFPVAKRARIILFISSTRDST